jgi:hypothetical protein
MREGTVVTLAEREEIEDRLKEVVSSWLRY